MTKEPPSSASGRIASAISSVPSETLNSVDLAKVSGRFS
jgi:hypothetical protein